MDIRAFIGMLLVSLIAVPARAQLCFDEQVISFSPARLGVIATADMDGDLDEDIVAATVDAIEWFENNGDGTFATQPTTLLVPSDFDLVAFNIARLIAVDLDGDGNTDIVAINKPGIVEEYDLLVSAGGVHSAFLNSTVPTEVTPENLILADIYSKGGDIELLTGGMRYYYQIGSDAYISGDLKVFPKFSGELVGVGNLRSSISNGLDLVLDSGDWYRAVTGEDFVFMGGIHPLASGKLRLVDINGDTNMDLFSDSGLWFRSNGQSFPLFDHRVITSLPDAGHLNPADLDNDSDLDFVGDGGFWFENLGGYDANFVAHSLPLDPFGIDVINPPFILGDIDGDGDIDIVAQDGSGWYRNSFDEPVGEFEFARIDLVDPDSVLAVGDGQLADIDGEGDLDLAVANFDSSTVSLHANSMATNEATGERTGWLEDLVLSASPGDTITAEPGVFKCLPSRDCG